MLFYSMFHTLVGKEITVELKNELRVTGVLTSVDEYLNFKLQNITFSEPAKVPQLVSMKNAFIRGSVIRYVSLRRQDVDLESIQDATRVDARLASQAAQGAQKKK